MSAEVGGGGGGAGGGTIDVFPGTSSWGGGGGGGGWPYGSGGLGYDTTYAPHNGQNGQNAPSSVGTALGGAGHDAAYNGGNSGSTYASDGLESENAVYSDNGTAGDAIHGQSFIVWENIGTIYGATS